MTRAGGVARYRRGLLVSVSVLKETPRWLVLGVVSLYVVAMVAGFVVAPWDLSPPASPVQLSVVGTAVHNLTVVGILFLGGMGFLIPTAVVGAWNGFLVGALMASLTAAPNWWIATLAHGVPECAAQCCAMVGGAELLYWLLGWLRGRPFTVPRSALGWVGLAVAGTLVAACVEGTLSPFLVEVLAT